MSTSRDVLDPIAKLKAASGVSGLCFLNKTCSSYEYLYSSDLCRTRRCAHDSGDAHAHAHSDDDSVDSSKDVFVANNSSNTAESDSDEDAIHFQCRSIAWPNQTKEQWQSSSLLRESMLATCHNKGSAKVWDLARQQVVYEFGNDRPGPGLALRRIDPSDNNSDSSIPSSPCFSRVLYQSRDPEGTVSLHDLKQKENKSSAQKPLVTVQTYSQTFCNASPCAGDSNLVALPSRDSSFASIRDWRMSPSSHPVAYIHGASGSRPNPKTSTTTTSSSSSLPKDHGMLTSLAMMSNGSGAAACRPVLACGFEDGNIFFHDLAMMRNGTSNANAPLFHCQSSNSLSLSSKSSPSKTSDPVLTLDVAPSKHDNDAEKMSFVAIAGLAGHTADLVELPLEEQGRVAMIKGSRTVRSTHQTRDQLKKEQASNKISLRLRTRLGPTLSKNMTSATGPGLAGISVCRWRKPDGRLFAAGGWDKRVRIYDRAAAVMNKGDDSGNNGSGRMLAVLKGHRTGVTALDWAPDAKTSGLLATGSSDGSVCVWRCFGQDGQK